MRLVRSALALVLVAGLVAVALWAMPRSWTADPISTAPRSMMGSGFVNDHLDVAPWTWWWSRHLDLAVEHPDTTNIIIWNHHTEAMTEAPSCMGSHYFPPPSIMALEAIGRTRVYYLCTRSTQNPEKPHFALQRRDEITDLVGRFRALGIPPARIFLAGQSGGSCASLFALGAAPGQMNAGILFAPACTNMGEGFRRMGGVPSPGAREIEAALLEQDSITALLVAFDQDSWNKPDDLAFLTARWPETVAIFSPHCGANHSGAFHGCGLDAVAREVETYFRDRLAAHGIETP